ncbi:hypothetical protein [Sphingorhabdus contaminans]|uniref:Transporter n=1 Tax=Sphingorhabdus contaminans TaxID=1343899 RepID=A0A553WA92_9SPHN|nr:hypothetical protein [Sphingorhabdus contaminans]TSB01603.1 hypothetical protein FOM92_10485 [Sphingorhabdus contaminans]
MNHKLTLYAAAAAFAFSAMPAFAQSVDDQVDKAEQRQDRIDRNINIPGSAAQAFLLEANDGSTIAFNFAAPVTWNNNIDLVENGPKLASVHINPAVRLEWRSAGAVQIFAGFNADHDFYTQGSDYDASTLGARIGMRLVDDSLGGVRPYAYYSPLIVYGGGFTDKQATLHNITIGLGNTLELGGGTQLTSDLSATRREASFRALEQDRVSAAVALSGQFGEKLGWLAEQSAQHRWYTGGVNQGRKDLNLATTLALSYAVSESGVLDIGVTFERNTSDRIAKDYSVWDAGPTLRFIMIF